MNKIINKAFCEIEFCGRKHVVETLDTVVSLIKIEIEREEPCCFALENDNIKYAFKVKNLSDVNLQNVIFKDIIDRKCEYVCGSLTINGAPRKAFVHGDVLECSIQELKAYEILTICFDVKTKEFRNNRCNSDCENRNDFEGRSFNNGYCCNRCDCESNRDNFFYSNMIK